MIWTVLTWFPVYVQRQSDQPGLFTSSLKLPENGDDGAAGCFFGRLGRARARCAQTAPYPKQHTVRFFDHVRNEELRSDEHGQGLVATSAAGGGELVESDQVTSIEKCNRRALSRSPGRSGPRGRSVARHAS
jgi:hypothetical protein